MDICVWDIETTNLRANVGRIICAVGKDLHSDALRTFRRDQPPHKHGGKPSISDRLVVRDFREYLSQFDIWVTWNGKMFDVPFVNTRLLEFGFPELNRPFHIDLMYQFRKPQLAMTSSKLKTCLQFMECDTQKPSLPPKVWRAANEGDPKATQQVVDRCIADVNGTLEIYEKIKHRVRSIRR